MLKEKIRTAKEYIQERVSTVPEIGIILGSGLGSLADRIENASSIPYKDIPNFANSHALGHANELVFGKLSGKSIVAMKGRFHYYEGYTANEVTFPIHIMNALGVQKLIITNACGAVNTDFNPGDLMIISDHINLTGTNPFIGPNDDELGPRFTDLSNVYDLQFQSLAQNIAFKNKIHIRKGVYAWWTGPAYETPAEIRMIRTLGADAVGMSTVPEAMVAAYYGMNTLGISCLTNMACGILDQPLNHDEVIDTASKVKTKFSTLITEIIREI